MSNPADLISFALLLLPVGDWIAAVVLWQAHRHNPRLKALRERAQAAVILAISASVVAVLALNRLLSLGISPLILTPLFVGALLLMSAPAYLWLWLYWRGR